MAFFFLFVYLYGGAYEAESMLMTRKRHSTFFLLLHKTFFAEQNTHFLAEGLHGEFLLYMCF